MAYMVNVKGVFHRASRCATIAAIMKKNGKWVRGLGGNIGMADPVMTELWDIYYGLEMAWERVKLDVVLFSECKEAITAMENNDLEFPMAMVVDMIRMPMGETCINVDIQPTFSDANRGANAMANHFVGAEGGIVEMQQPPATISHLV